MLTFINMTLTGILHQKKGLVGFFNDRDCKIQYVNYLVMDSFRFLFSFLRV